MQESSQLISVVLDTNVFVAAYWAPASASAVLVAACSEARLQAKYSPQVKDEVLHVLRTIRARSSFVDGLEAFWKRAVEVEPATAPGVRVADADDVKFIEAAVGGDVDFLVTNDEHLLSVGYVGRTEIITPASVLRLLSS